MLYRCKYRIFLSNLFVIGMFKNLKCINALTLMLLLRHHQYCILKLQNQLQKECPSRSQFPRPFLPWALCWLLHNLACRPFSVSQNLMVCSPGLLPQLFDSCFFFKVLVGQKNFFQFQVLWVLKMTFYIYTKNCKLFPHQESHLSPKKNLKKYTFVS